MSHPLEKWLPKETIEKIVYVPAFQHNRDEIIQWSQEQGFRATMLGSLNMNDIWYVDNDADRVIFTLRWC